MKNKNDIVSNIIVYTIFAIVMLMIFAAIPAAIYKDKKEREIAKRELAERLAEIDRITNSIFENK